MHFENYAGFIHLSLEMWEFNMNGDAFVQALKDRIPRKDREYEPINRIWTIKAEYLETIQQLRKEFL